jgi:hypothetical protein
MEELKQKVIMYDSPEAATYRTNIEGWVNSEGRFYGKEEHLARWSGCTHIKCEGCGKPIPVRSYTRCEDCRHKIAVENYNKLPFVEWDETEPVVTWDKDTYFFSLEDLIEFLEDNEMNEIDLLLCEENKWHAIPWDYWSDMMPEGQDELPEALEKALKEFNKVISELPTQSYSPGKVRTSYKLDTSHNQTS